MNKEPVNYNKYLKRGALTALGAGAVYLLLPGGYDADNKVGETTAIVNPGSTPIDAVREATNELAPTVGCDATSINVVSPTQEAARGGTTAQPGDRYTVSIDNSCHIDVKKAN